MADDLDKLEGKLVESIKIEGLGEIVQEYTELGIDLVLKDGVLKDVPIVGTLVKAMNAIGCVRDRLYLKKLILFLHKIGETTQRQREDFIKDNCHDIKHFEEAVLLILEQADNMNKPSLIGKIFKACILGKINLCNAIRLSEMVNRAFWDDLLCLTKGTENVWQKEKLLLAGFYDQDGSGLFGDGDKRTPLLLHQNYYTEAIILIAKEHYDKLDSLKSLTV